MINSKLIIYIVALSSGFVFCNKAVAAKNRYKTFPEVVNYQGYEFSIATQYFSSSSRYDADGKEVALDENYSYTNIDFDAEGKYGFSERLEFRGGLRGRYAKAILNQTGGYSLTARGMESYMVAAKYFLPMKRWKYALDFKFRQTVYSNSSGANVNAEEMVLGDDGIEMTGSLLLGYKSASLFRFSSLVGYNMPPNDLSHEILYNAEFAWEFYTGSAFILGVKGIYSLKNDPYYNNQAETRPYMNTGNSSLYNSTNRQYVAPYIGGRFHFSSITLDFGAAYRTQGVFAESGLELSFKFSYGKEGITIEKKKINKFKEYEVEASIIKVSPRGVFVKIDKGMADAIEKGMMFDIFKTDYFSGNILVASGIVYEVRPSYSIVKIKKKYKQNLRLKIGLRARGYLD